jgi:co-chaperonin GroES (HSP10)
MSDFMFKPAPGTVCVELVKETASKSGIITSVKSDSRYPAKGIVLASNDDDFVSVGDVILYDMGITEDLEVGGKTFDLVLEQNILGVFK